MGQIRLKTSKTFRRQKNKTDRRYKKCCALTAALLLFSASHAFAGWRLVIDTKTIAQVSANAAAQKAIEDKHNERLDTISDKQKKFCSTPPPWKASRNSTT